LKRKKLQTGTAKQFQTQKSLNKIFGTNPGKLAKLVITKTKVTNGVIFAPYQGTIRI
jgi:hypothetical protein